MWITKRIPLSTSSTDGLVRRIIGSKDTSISALALALFASDFLEFLAEFKRADKI